MTNAEKLDWLYRLKSEIYVYMPKEWLIPMGNALDVAIKALEQTEKREEMIYMLLNEVDVEANNLKDSKMKYDIGFRDGINFIAHKLEALMKL